MWNFSQEIEQALARCLVQVCRPQISGGFYGYTAPKPSLVLVSSAATERNALIGDNAEARKADIPIVQLNPGGVLNHKYAGEQAVSG